MSRVQRSPTTSSALATAQHWSWDRMGNLPPDHDFVLDYFKIIL